MNEEDKRLKREANRWKAKVSMDGMSKSTRKTLEDQHDQTKVGETTA